MSAIGERDDDFFDFSDQIISDLQPQQVSEEVKSSSFKNHNNEVQTSYVLVNALMSLLIQKGVIYPHEVQSLVSELHAEYIKKKGTGPNGTN